MKADMLKKLLQAGALAAEAGSRGSAGNIASKIVESGLDLSDWRKKNKKDIKPKEHDQSVNEKKKILNPTVSDPFGKNKTNYYA
tara:strand:- start:54 stop:305 length:252 start_codon:yes stop_codon:yes gene_type:complete